MRYGWDDAEQFSRVVGEKFWWDNEDLEGEMGTHTARYTGIHGPLTRYVKLGIAHAPGMPGTFSPPPTSKETAS